MSADVTQLISDLRVQQLIDDAWQPTVDEGCQFSEWSVRDAIRVAIRETAEACATLCEEVGSRVQKTLQQQYPGDSLDAAGITLSGAVGGAGTCAAAIRARLT